MRHLFFVFALFLHTLSTSSAQLPQIESSKPAQNTPSCSHIHTVAATLAAQQSAVVRRPYDVLSYSLDIDWTGPLSTTATTGEARTFPAVNTMLVRIDSAGVHALELDSRTAAINRVTINEEEVTVE